MQPRGVRYKDRKSCAGIPRTEGERDGNNRPPRRPVPDEGPPEFIGIEGRARDQMRAGLCAARKKGFGGTEFQGHSII